MIMVILEITFSEPLSFVFWNRFRPPFPVNAPEIPSDFPLCRSDNTISIADTIINKAFSIQTPFACASVIITSNILPFNTKMAAGRQPPLFCSYTQLIPYEAMSFANSAEFANPVCILDQRQLISLHVSLH